MKDAINYFIPILKDPMNDITGRCMTNNGLDNAYCGSYHPPPTAKATQQPRQPVNVHFPDVQMETNSMEIQYNNLIEIDDYPAALQYQRQQQEQQRLQQNRKRNNFDCDIDSMANAKRCRREDAVTDKRASSVKLPMPEEYAKPRQREEAAHIEEMLMHTHGSTAYHWQGQGHEI